jgi:carbamoyltransferase|tara:strand:+ start:6656 stop:8299 length:1644 start_codon:yes stop_codon:yes gene_type:complete
MDGKLVAAITEERLSRVKRDKRFPNQAIKYVCDIAKIDVSEITDVFVGWNPVHYMHKSDNTLLDALQNRGKIAYLALDELSAMSDSRVIEITQNVRTENSECNIHFVDHHLAHLCNAFCTSGFKRSDFFVADGFGEVTTGLLGYVTSNKIHEFDEFRSPHSLGSFYSTFTDFLGFKANSDEWKVMALASLGDHHVYYDKVRSLIRVDDLQVELDLSYFEHFLFFTQDYFTNKFVNEFGPRVTDTNNLDQQHFNLVAAVQKVVEDVVIEILHNLHKRTDAKHLVVSGGFFMNSVLNGKIIDRTPYEHLHIGGSPDDSGISIGSALYGLRYKLNDDKENELMNHNYLGGEYSDEQVIHELEKRKVRYKQITSIENFAATKLKQGKIVGWFQGKSEFGQRALGNRSILADPTIPDIKNKINSSIKYREEFRPFAPSILHEKQREYFSSAKSQTSYFMERVFTFDEWCHEALPGVVHFDKTGRLQTVSESINPRYYRLISEFGKLSGHPVVLNTSFNLNGMPLVETPAHAIDCFYQSGIDCLIMGNVVVEK